MGKLSDVLTTVANNASPLVEREINSLLSRISVWLDKNTLKAPA